MTHYRIFERVNGAARCDFCGGPWFPGYDDQVPADEGEGLLRQCAYCAEVRARYEAET